MWFHGNTTSFAQNAQYPGTAGGEDFAVSSKSGLSQIADID